MLYLNNGSIIRGTLLEYVPGQQVKIQTADGSVFVYPVSDVERLAKEPRVSPAIPAEEEIEGGEAPRQRPSPGYRVFLENSFGVGAEFVSSTVSGAFGMQITPFFYLGGGVGSRLVIGRHFAWLLPLSASVRFDVGSWISFYTEVRGGYAFKIFGREGILML